MNKILDDFNKYMDSPEGKVEIEKYFNKLDEKDNIQKKRFKMFEDWVELNSFNKLMYRLILEHDDNYIEKCQNNGFMPYPNNKLRFVVDYIFNSFEEIKVKQLDCDFPNNIRYFKEYYFQHIYGQGTILRIYCIYNNKLILQL